MVGWWNFITPVCTINTTHSCTIFLPSVISQLQLMYALAKTHTWTLKGKKKMSLAQEDRLLLTYTAEINFKPLSVCVNSWSCHAYLHGLQHWKKKTKYNSVSKLNIHWNISLLSTCFEGTLKVTITMIQRQQKLITSTVLLCLLYAWLCSSKICTNPIDKWNQSCFLFSTLKDGLQLVPCVR